MRADCPLPSTTAATRPSEAILPAAKSYWDAEHTCPKSRGWLYPATSGVQRKPTSTGGPPPPYPALSSMAEVPQKAD